MGSLGDASGEGGPGTGGLSEASALLKSLVVEESSGAERGWMGPPDAEGVGGEVCPPGVFRGPYNIGRGGR